MAAMTTPLVEFSDSTNSRLYTVSGHTVAQPKVVVQRRRVPTNVDGQYHSEINVSYGTLDADGNPLDKKYFFGVTIRGPVAGQSADRDAAKALFREIVASDEFDSVTATQNYIS